MDYRELTELAKHYRQTFGRIVKCETYSMPDGILAITRMHDDFHDINLAMLFDDSYRVKDVAVEMERIPFPQCETLPRKSLKNIIGLSLNQKGVMRRVKELIPRKEGCTHIYEVLESTFRAVFVGSYSVIGELYEGALDLGLEEERQYWMSTPVLRDTCYSFSTETADEEILSRALEKIEEASTKAAKIKEVKKGNTNREP